MSERRAMYTLEGGVGSAFCDSSGTVVAAGRKSLHLYCLGELRTLGAVSGGRSSVRFTASKAALLVQSHKPPTDFTVGNKPNAMDSSSSIGAEASDGAGESAADDESSYAEFKTPHLATLTCLACCSRIFKYMLAVGDALGRCQLIGLGTERHREVYDIVRVGDAEQPGDEDDSDDDTASNDDTATWRDHRDGVTCLAFSRSGHNLATGSNDMTVRVYSIFVHGTKDELGQRGVRRVSIQPIFISTVGLHPFGLPGQHQTDHRRRRRTSVNAHSQSLAGNQDTEEDDPNQRFCGHLAPVRSVCFSPSGSTVYSGDEAGDVLAWWWRADPSVDLVAAALSKHNDAVRKCLLQLFNKVLAFPSSMPESLTF